MQDSKMSTVQQRCQQVQVSVSKVNEFITKAKDMSFIVTAKATDFCFPCQGQGQGHCFLENFSRTSPDSVFHHLLRPKIYK